MKHSWVLLRDSYGTEEMRQVWAEDNLVQKWLDFEKAIALAEAEYGVIPREAAEEIASKCSVKFLTPEMVARYKAETGHLIVSFIKAFAEMCGPAGEHFHVGPTTQDILDTGLTLQAKDAYEVLMKQLRGLEEVLYKLAERHKHTVMMGRTHGQHAVPVTFGFKVAVWAWEIRDHIERLEELAKRLFVTKLSAATGTQNTFAYLLGAERVNAFVQRVCDQIGLGRSVMDPGHRTDRFAELCSVLAMLCSTLGEMGIETRDLQRTEVAEVEEPWDPAKHHGSSTMPHKRNPEPSEWQEGVAKLARANAMAMMDIQMQHERDATRTAAEYSCIPENFLFASASVKRATHIFGSLRVNTERMRKNLYHLQGLAMSEVMMLKLWQKSGKKVTAHQLVHDLSMKAFEEERPFLEVLRESPEVRSYLSEEEIEEAMNPEKYYGTAALQVDALLDSLAAKGRKT